LVGGALELEVEGLRGGGCERGMRGVHLDEGADEARTLKMDGNKRHSPCCPSQYAILARLVLLPTPLTPQKTMTYGRPLARWRCGFERGRGRGEETRAEG